MLRTHHTPTHLGSAGIVSGILVLLGAFFLLDAQPEFVQATSADGVLVVEGTVPEGIEIRLVQDIAASESPWTAVVSPIYRIEPETVLLPAPVVMQFASQTGPESGRSIGFFDVDRGVWIPQETTWNQARKAYQTATTRFSPSALLRTPAVVMTEQEQATLLTDIEALLPLGAVGYTVDLAYATVPGDAVLFATEVDRRVCAQSSATRTKYVHTALDRSATLRLDGVPTPALVRALVRWDMGAGCAEFVRPTPSAAQVF